jgi:hypothetical protein
MKIKRILTAGMLIASMLLMTISSAQASPNPAVLPPEARVQGLTLGEWHAEFWRATLAIPASQHPVSAIHGQRYIECIETLIVSHLIRRIECEMPVGMVLYF